MGLRLCQTPEVFSPQYLQAVHLPKGSFLLSSNKEFLIIYNIIVSETNMHAYTHSSVGVASSWCGHMLLGSL